jgi:hypothetical protein
MVSNDPIRDYMNSMAAASPKPSRRSPPSWSRPTARDIRSALQTLARAGAPVDLLEALEAWSDDQMQQAA